MYKESYGYAIQVSGKTRPFLYLTGSSHPDAAADAVVGLWREHAEDADEVVVELPPEVEAALRCRGPLPWTRKVSPET